jgi:hypothetical protein
MLNKTFFDRVKGYARRKMAGRLKKSTSGCRYHLMRLGSDNPPKRKGRNIIIACMAKSGSTFVAKTLSAITEYPERGLLRDSESQVIDYYEVQIAKGMGIITQQHIICSQHTVNMANEFDLDVVVLERNILDVLVSLRDFLLSEEMQNSRKRFGGFLNTGQQFLVDEEFYEMDDSERYDFLILYALPWYIHFHMTWRKYHSFFKKPPLRLTYESFFADIEGSVKQILSHCDLSHLNHKISECLNPSGNTRLNQGLPGRGGGEPFQRIKFKRSKNRWRTILSLNKNSLWRVRNTETITNSIQL